MTRSDTCKVSALFLVPKSVLLPLSLLGPNSQYPQYRGEKVRVTVAQFLRGSFQTLPAPRQKHMFEAAHRQRKSADLMAARKQSREDLGTRIRPSRTCPQWPTLSSQAPTLNMKPSRSILDLVQSTLHNFSKCVHENWGSDHFFCSCCTLYTPGIQSTIQ